MSAAIEPRKFALQVVEFYASRLRMSLVAQGELEREIAARLAAEQGTSTDFDPAALVNATLADWERRHGGRGPRIAIAGLSQVVERRPSRP